LGGDTELARIVAEFGGDVETDYRRAGSTRHVGQLCIAIRLGRQKTATKSLVKARPTHL